MLIRYRSYTITYNPKPIPLRSDDYDWGHDDYDGPGDRRCGTAASGEDAKRQIDEIEADLADDAAALDKSEAADVAGDAGRKDAAEAQR